MEKIILPLLKVNLGTKKSNRDDYLTAIIKSVIEELTNEKGIVLDDNNYKHLMFVVDYSAWRYRSRGEGACPRNLQFRLHNLVIANGRGIDA